MSRMSLTGRDIRPAKRNASLAVDTSGEGLSAFISARPRLIKPNRAELAQAVGRELESISDVITAAEELRARGVERVLVSLGADGAVMVGEHGTVVGESTVPQQRSTVGAGDYFLAGFLSKYSTMNPIRMRRLLRPSPGEQLP